MAKERETRRTIEWLICDVCSVGDTYQKGSIVEQRADAGRRDGDSQTTDSVCSRLCEPFVCRSSVVVVVVGGGGRARTWVSGADVKLLFGHLSDRRPRRLPVSVKIVRGHQPRRWTIRDKKSSPLHFIYIEISVLRVFRIFQRFLLQYLRFWWSDSRCLKAIRHRKLGRSSDAH
jgi:hypothetical protein